MTALVDIGGVRLPCAVDFVIKDKWVTDEKTGKSKRQGSKTKNEQYREMVSACAGNLPIDYVVNDCWFSKEAGKYVNIETLQPGQQAVEVWFPELDFPLLLAKQIFKNEDDTVGELYLACSDLSLSYGQITTIYKKRWGVEEFHKSLKSNTGFSKSPTHTVKTQTSHFILSIIAYVKLEWLRVRNRLNHFAMKNKIYQAALKVAHAELKRLSTPIAA